MYTKLQQMGNLGLCVERDRTLDVGMNLFRVVLVASLHFFCKNLAQAYMIEFLWVLPSHSERG